MDYTYTFGDPSTLYLNVTNRCTNRCTFCVRDLTSHLGTGQLRGGPEPDLPTLLAAIHDHGDLEALAEVVWCGFGEPTFRLDLIVGAAPALREAGIGRIRLNTNGHGCLIQGRDVLPELAGAIDAVSVSLNAPGPERYLRLCQPQPSALAAAPEPRRFWEATIEFLTRAPARFREVQASVVGHALGLAEVDAARELARDLGADFLVR